jgi:hypothetical protein
MKNAKITQCGIYLFCFFILVCLFPVAADASKNENGKWSFEFNNCTILDALKKISDRANIAIVTNYSDAEAKLNKSYNSKAIEKIIADLFKKENCAIVWQYDKEKLNGVKILVYESSKETIRNKNFALNRNPGSFSGQSKRINSPISAYRSPRVSPQRQSIPYSASFSRQIKNTNYKNKPVSADSSTSNSVSSAGSTSYYKNKDSNVEKIAPVAVHPRSSNINTRSVSLPKPTQENNEASPNIFASNKPVVLPNTANEVETIHVSEQKDNVEQEIIDDSSSENNDPKEESEPSKPASPSEDTDSSFENPLDNQGSDNNDSNEGSDKPAIPSENTESTSETSQDDQNTDDSNNNDNNDDNEDKTPPQNDNIEHE